MLLDLESTRGRRLIIMTQRREPVACSLPLTDAASQAGEWIELHRRAVRSEEIPNGFAVTYPRDMAETVQDLAEREARCCAWLDISTTMVTDGIRLELASDHPDAGPVIALLAGRS